MAHAYRQFQVFAVHTCRAAEPNADAISDANCYADTDAFTNSDGHTDA